MASWPTRPSCFASSAPRWWRSCASTVCRRPSRRVDPTPVGTGRASGDGKPITRWKTVMTTIDGNSLLLQMRRISAQPEMPALRGVGEAAPVARSSFGDMLKQSIESVNESQDKAGKMAASFERGDPGIDLAQVMIQGQKADLSFRAMTEVRNKMVDAYKEIMNMSLYAAFASLLCV